MIRTVKRTVIKPAIIIGIDNSSSIVMNEDSAFYRKEFLKGIGNLKEDLGDDYEVHTYNFGEGLSVDRSPDFKDQLTDISSLFNEVGTRYFNRNIGAVIVASDGIYNSGSDPIYEVRNSRFPVYTINLGDTTSRKDIRIQKVVHNKTAFKGNLFPIEITIQAIEVQGEKATVSIIDGDETVFTHDISITSNNQVIIVPALLNADETGLKRLRILVDELEGEVNTGNNARDIFIEVMENKIRIALISDAPHPDVAALQRVIESSNNFELELYMASEFAGKNPEAFSLIILNQLPSVKNAFTAQMNNIIKSNTPLMFIIGGQSNVQTLNSFDLGLSLTNFKGSYNEALPSVNQSFSLFLYNEAQKRLLEGVPPLVSPFASYNIANSVQVFASQTIGPTVTNMPLILFNEKQGKRISIISGEGIWRWRIYDYMQNSSHTNFDNLIIKVFQYLTAQTDKSRFRVNWNNFYAENENIEFGALLLNESYEPVTEPEVTMEITDENGQNFDYSFSSGNQRYNIKVGTFPPGMYTFEAKANFPGEVMVKRGTFVVTAVKMEDINLLANHKLLNTMASESGGKSYYPSNFSALSSDIKAREDVKSVTYTRRNYMDLIDYYPLMILLFLLLGAEWLLRKYSGSY